MITFFVEGKPQAKARARVVRNRHTGKVHSYTPEKTAAYEDLIRWSYKAAGGEYMGEKLLEAEIQAFYPIPKSTTKKARLAIMQEDIRPQTKPDCDNIIKVVLDALNGVAYYDDKQVVCVSCNKYYGDMGYLKITLKELGEEARGNSRCKEKSE